MPHFIKQFCLLLSFTALTLHSQKNIFLERSYWKDKPGIASIKAGIAAGNDPSQLNNNGFDPTVYAIIEQAPDESVRFLLTQKGNDVNKITHDGRTYIFWAAYKGNVGLMEHLLSLGAKTDIIDDHGNTILNFAASTGQADTKVYDLCLREGANLKKDLDRNGANALLLAAPYDTSFHLINYFIAGGLELTSTDNHGNTAFNYAARTGNIAFMDALIQKGVRFNDYAVIMASQGTRSHANSLELYHYLERMNLKPTTTGRNGENALHAIVRKEKQNEVIRYFLAAGVDVNQPDHDGNTAFMNAAGANRETEAVSLLAANVKNINQVNKKGISALALAVQYNTPEVVSLLLEKGADVNLVAANGDNLAYNLVQSYNAQKPEAFEAKLKLLQGKGFDITKVPASGNTLYHLAVARNDLSLVKHIGTFKPDVNARNKEGYTALHKAAMNAQDDKILKHLLSAGARKEEQTSFNERAFDLAKENELLQKNKISIDFLK